MSRLSWLATTSLKSKQRPFLRIPIVVRPMSIATVHSFMVYAPDYPDAAERRQKVREQHLMEAKGLHDSGAMPIGGALLSPDSIETEGAPRKMVGSLLIIRAESLAEVRKRVESDIYWTSEVWDKERLVIMPFVQAQSPK